jgi:uncharacterized RDD family membrane protein YckC
MVLKNPFDSSSENREMASLPGHHLSDRLKACAFDFFLIAPLASFLMMPFFRSLEKVIYVQPQAMNSSTLWISFAALAGLTVIAVLTSFYVLLQATPGMRLFKLKLQSIDGARITFTQALFRSFGILLSFFALGIPFISILADNKNQSWYDRMVQLEVKSEKADFSFNPFPVFRFEQLSHLFSLTGMSLCVLVFGSHFSSEVSYWVGLKPADQSFCESVIERPDTSRIESALKLFEFDFIDADCLRQEALKASFSLNEDERKFASVARYLTVEDAGLSKKYLNLVCSGSDRFFCHEAARMAAKSESISFRAKPSSSPPKVDRLSELREGF